MRVMSAILTPSLTLCSFSASVRFGKCSASSACPSVSFHKRTVHVGFSVVHVAR